MSPTETLTPSDFLLARIADDEAVAQEATVSPAYRGSFGETAAEEIVHLALSEGAERAGADHFENWMPARVLAECAAKRAIVKSRKSFLAVKDQGPLESRLTAAGAAAGLDYAIRVLAAAHATHEDYRAEWAV